ncbi:MAG TPA: TMEM43 family protein, partial [Acidobacteriota bacterium]|nr:TMEM43 family protein [Acidobacteriota bacterium]
NPNSPQIGDMRISFEIIKPAVVSIVAKQSQGKLAVFQTSSGSDIALLQVGTVTPEAMFQSAMSSSAAATWGLRLFGWLLMFGGIMLVVKPLVTIADVIPFLGSILEFGLSIFAAVISATLSMFTIALGWLFFRPMIGIALLFVTGLLAGGAVFMMLRNRSARPAYPQQPQSVQY